MDAMVRACQAIQFLKSLTPEDRRVVVELAKEAEASDGEIQTVDLRAAILDIAEQLRG